MKRRAGRNRQPQQQQPARVSAPAAAVTFGSSYNGSTGSTEYANTLYGTASGGSSTRRQSEPPDNYNVGSQGIAFVPRRGIGDQALLTTKRALLQYAQGTPLRLLSILPDIHPAFGLALWNCLRLSAPPDGLRIVAVKPVAPGQAAKASSLAETETSGDDGAGPGAKPKARKRVSLASLSASTGGVGEGEIDEAGTAILDAFWESQPAELGGLHGLQTTLTIASMLTGLPFLEAVPGSEGTGLRRVFPVSSLSIRFNREGDDGEVVPYQLQRQPRGEGKGGYVRLDTARMFWRAIDSDPDDPYGRVPFGPALPEILRDLAMIQDLTDAMHFAAYPRGAFGINFTELYKIAKEVYGITDKTEAAKWVNAQVAQLRKTINGLKPDEALFYDSNGDFKVVDGSKGFAALETILTYLRQRVTMAVKSLPTLLGIGDGGTQTRNTVEWQIYALGLETVRHIVAEIIVRAANLHLQLLGLPLIAKAIYEPIRTVDAQMDATTDSTKNKNEAFKVAMGWQTNDEAANNVTGSDAVAEPNYAAAGMGVNAGAQPGDDDGSLGTTSGTTKEETDATGKKAGGGAGKSGKQKPADDEEEGDEE